MKWRRQWIALGVAAAAGVAGCGGPSDEEKRAAQQRYARAANAICTQDVNRYVAYTGDRASTYLGLNSYTIATRQRLEIAATKLHRLKAKLGDSRSDQIDAFDRALDPFVTSLRALDGVDDADATKRAAARIRRRGDMLFRAAQAASAMRCGRGGNAIADRAELVVYAVAFRRVDDAAQQRLTPLIRRFDRAAEGSDAQVTASRRITRVYQILYRGMGHLDPPRKLRRVHQAVRRRLRDVLDIREQAGSVTQTRFEVLRARLRVRARRYFRAERRLLRALNS